MYDVNKNIIGKTKISINQIGKIKEYKWGLIKNGYVRTVKKNKYIYLHRLIMDAQKYQIIDHINRDPLDNRNENLRFCNSSQNCMNEIKDKNRKMLQGVGYHNYDKRKKKWTASIGAYNKKINLGYFLTENEAIKARLLAEKEYFGEFMTTEHKKLLEEYNL